MSATNYEMAVQSAQDAYEWSVAEDPHIAAINGQTYATLALVDLIEKKTAAPFAKSNVKPPKNTSYVIGTSAINALHQFKDSIHFSTRDDADEFLNHIGRPLDQAIYRVSVEVVQS